MGITLRLRTVAEFIPGILQVRIPPDVQQPVILPVPIAMTAFHAIGTGTDEGFEDQVMDEIAFMAETDPEIHADITAGSVSAPEFPPLLNRTCLMPRPLTTPN